MPVMALFLWTLAGAVSGGVFGYFWAMLEIWQKDARDAVLLRMPGPDGGPPLLPSDRVHRSPIPVAIACAFWGAILGAWLGPWVLLMLLQVPYTPWSVKRYAAKFSHRPVVASR
jgi:hypothetical protein